jgi:hypothetical protein
VTALAATRGASGGYLPDAASGADRAIRISTAVVVLAVAGIAAYISYWHAYAVIREYGESGITARLEPATIDGLVYASSMVILYAARHQLPVPRLARWLLTLGIIATLAANMAQGWSHGPSGMIVAAWPAVSLAGSYELLAWIIRKAAAGDPDHLPAADHCSPQPDHPGAGPQPAVAQVPDAGPGHRYEQITDLVPADEDGPQPLPCTAQPGQESGPGRDAADHADQAADQIPACPHMASTGSGDSGINAAAVAAYRISVRTGQPLSERKLAGMFGKTSRRWARNRITEARQSPTLGW